ncbi:MAG: AarF/ABC1/UbiB kinase family protein [Methanomicrobiaceae archaeon]|nr:AarF/ABC1/UbiB kinase family protein [Methanomicrobiaceae archaeon]
MVSRIRRYGQIADILVKYGFGILAEEYLPGGKRRKVPRELPEEDKRPVYVRIRLAFEELGPTYIKFGQILSTRRELLPPGLIDELQKLQDQVAPLPFEEIRPVIEEYCPDIEACFERIEAEPIASASLSQVHRAVLKDGRQIVLKVQRPGIPDLIETDLIILQSLAERVESLFPDSRIYNPTGMVREFSTQIRKELDFVRDGKNADRLALHMKRVPGIKVPRIYWSYTSTRMLAMEYVEGVRVDDLDAIREMHVDPAGVAERGFAAYIQQVFIDGVFHGDPHPGNLLVTPRGDLVFLDFGIFGVMRPEKRAVFIDLLRGIIDADVDAVMKSFAQIGIRVDDRDLDALKDDLYAVFLDYREFQISQFDASMALYGLTETLRRYRIRVPGSMMLIFKVIVMISDLGVQLDPNFNFDERIRPYLTEISTSTMISPEITRSTMHTIRDSAESLLALPQTVNDALSRFKAGEIQFEIDEQNLAFTSQMLDRLSDKLLMGLIVAATVVGSSLVLVGSDLVLPAEVSYLAIIGYSVAMIAGFYAVIHAALTGLKARRR